MKPLASVVVAGSRFGQFYAAGLAASPDWHLAGLLGLGSPRSRALADRLAVPLLDTVSAIPDGVTLACVAVGGAARGMPGVALAMQLMERGIDVLIEHPLLPTEWEAVLREASRLGRRCLLSSFYPGFPLVKRFVALCRELHAQGDLWHLEARCAVQLSFAALDILAEGVGSAGPWSLEVTPRSLSDLRDCRLVLGEVGVSLQVLNELTPDHDGQMATLLRLNALCDGGSLTLLSPHGPLVWEPSVEQPAASPEGLFPLFGDVPGRRAPEPQADRVSPRAFEIHPALAADLHAEPTGVSSTHPPAWASLQQSLWPQVAIAPLKALLGTGSLQAAQQRSLEVARLWQQLTAGLGFPAPSASAAVRPRSAPWQQPQSQPTGIRQAVRA